MATVGIIICTVALALGISKILGIVQDNLSKPGPPK